MGPTLILLIVSFFLGIQGTADATPVGVSSGLQGSSDILSPGQNTSGARATIYVPDDHPTIQDAIDAAGTGDEIIVRPGVYAENIDFLGKTIAVKSELGANVTVIDGNQTGSAVIFNSGEGMDTVLTGFTLTNGIGSVDPLGLLSGGGIYCQNSEPTIIGNVITQNVVTEGYGGGIFICKQSSPLVTHNMIHDNQAFECGGGIYERGSSSIFVNNVIFQNQCGESGGGISSTRTSFSIITNNTIWKNTAGTGGGIVIGRNSQSMITNTIVWNNYAPDGRQISVGVFGYPSIVTLSYSNIQGGAASISVKPDSTLNMGAGMLDVSPGLCDPTQKDFHLTWNSPCRYTGHKSAPWLPSTDFEGNPRQIYGAVSMGADEFYFHLYHLGDVIPGDDISVRIVGEPDMRVLLGHGSGILNPPTSTPYGNLYLADPIVQYDLDRIPARGIMFFTATVPPTWIPGDVEPFQALVGGSGFSLTRLTNLMRLVVDS